MPTTIYDVKTRYSVEGDAARKLDQIDKSAGRAGRSGLSLGGILGGIGIGLALRQGKKSFLDFNSSIEQSTVSIAAQSKLLKGGPWASAMTEAGTLFGFYQDKAKKSVGMTQDFLEMHQGIAASAIRAGVGMEQLKDMTVGATIAAQVLGERSDMVALDIKQMLTSQVTARDRTAQLLLASQGVSQEAFNKLKVGSKQRNDIIIKALGDPAFKTAAAALENTFAGVTSTLKDNIQITLGKVGLPLFKAVTAEVKRWNEWVDKNPAKIQEFATKFASALIAGFNVVKDVGQYIVEHKEIFLALGAAWAARGIGGAAVAAPVAAGVGLQMLANRIDEGQNKHIEAQGLLGRGSFVMDTIDRIAKQREMSSRTFGGLSGEQANKELTGSYIGLVNVIRDLGVVGRDGTLNIDLLRQKLMDVNKSIYGGFGPGLLTAAEATKVQLGEMATAFDAVGESIFSLTMNAKAAAVVAAQGSTRSTFERYEQERLKAARALEDARGTKGRPPSKTNVNVTAKIEVASQDPDRFAFGLIKSFEDIARNPSQAFDALPRGF